MLLGKQYSHVLHLGKMYSKNSIHIFTYRRYRNWQLARLIPSFEKTLQFSPLVFRSVITKYFQNFVNLFKKMFGSVSSRIIKRPHHFSHTIHTFRLQPPLLYLTTTKTLQKRKQKTAATQKWDQMRKYCSVYCTAVENGFLAETHLFHEELINKAERLKLRKRLERIQSWNCLFARLRWGQE